ncbi:MAG TPA: DivIVA domain-containing protein [Ilumatobacteraceae bacterium]|nr:DivIVA domain-containing protein [Ilumatobacteraceae bacterium]
MALSFSRPDPSSPDAVAAASFSTSRRGYDQSEVRDLLRMVAAEMARLQEREKFLERELRSAQRGSTNSAVALDEEVVTRMLGEEAARILSTAREAASQIKIRSEDAGARMLREATDEAQRLREEAEVEAARRRQDASADAESELVMAKQQGREMVNEARAYRERVLSELARRRELARQQIEQLMHGRDRLLQAFERSRLVAVDVMAELTPLGEPSEYVNLSPTTGPVPLMVPNQRPPRGAADIAEVAEAGEESEAPESPVSVTVIEASPDGADVEVEVEAVIEPEVEVEPPSTVVLMREMHEVHEHDERDDARKSAPVVALFGGDDDDETDDSAEASIDDGSRASVDDLFARLRAARADAVVERAQQAEVDESETIVEIEIIETDSTGDTTMLTIVDELAVFQPTPEAPLVEEALDDTLFGQRDASLTPIIVASARKLKRVLADEQNEILHTLRRNEPVRNIDTMLPWQTEQASRYAAAVQPELERAALIGAASIDGGSTKEHKADINRAGATKAAVEALTATIVAPLRERLERAVAEAEGDNSELATMVRSIYREWKTQRIDEHLDDVARAAFGRGALAAVVPGTHVCWMVDPNGPACPDAEDNALAGEVPAGQPFPTGHTGAPAHEGCRCMLALAPR